MGCGNARHILEGFMKDIQAVAALVRSDEMACIICGCTEDKACVDPQTAEPCHWVAPGLCSNPKCTDAFEKGDYLEEPGDFGLRNPIAHLTPEWRNKEQVINWVPTKEGDGVFTVMDPLTEPVAILRALVFGDPILIELPLKLGEYELDEDGSVKKFGLRKIGPGTWVMSPSLNSLQVHAFLVFCKVPEPAPWENQIIVVISMSALKAVGPVT
jgi:hypothetical protein